MDIQTWAETVAKRHFGSTRGASADDCHGDVEWFATLTFTVEGADREECERRVEALRAAIEDVPGVVFD